VVVLDVLVSAGFTSTLVEVLGGTLVSVLLQATRPRARSIARMNGDFIVVFLQRMVGSTRQQKPHLYALD
jgi:hypothetical protein